MKTWSFTHTVVGLNSCEPDCYAVLPESSKGLGLLAVAKDMDLRSHVKNNTLTHVRADVPFNAKALDI